MPLRFGTPRSVRPLVHPSRMGLLQTRLRRFQAAAFIAAFLLALTGAHFAGWFIPAALSPAHTLQTAALSVPAARIAAPAARPALAAASAPVRNVAAKTAVARPAAKAAPAAPDRSLRAETPAVETTAERTTAPGAFYAEGMASYYGSELAGRRTASGERFNPNELTAAHRTLPLGTRIRVTNPANGQSVVVRVNDRGPFHGNRILDLSHGAARAIGIALRGTGRVVIDVLERGSGRSRRAPAEEKAPAEPAPVATPDTAAPGPAPLPAAPTDSTRPA